MINKPLSPRKLYIFTQLATNCIRNRSFPPANPVENMVNNHTTLSTCSFIHQHRNSSVKHFQYEATFHDLSHVVLAALKCIDWLLFQYGGNIFP